MSRRPATATSPHKSPKKPKGTSNAAAPVTSADYENMLADQQHQMSMQVSEKEIEIERLKTTVATLGGKCAIVDDHLADVQNARDGLEKSHNDHRKLQDQLVEVSATVEKERDAKERFEDGLNQQIRQLQQDLRNEKQRQKEREDAWRNEKNDMQTRHHNELQ